MEVCVATLFLTICIFSSGNCLFIFFASFLCECWFSWPVVRTVYNLSSAFGKLVTWTYFTPTFSATCLPLLSQADEYKETSGFMTASKKRAGGELKAKSKKQTHKNTWNASTVPPEECWHQRGFKKPKRSRTSRLNPPYSWAKISLWFYVQELWTAYLLSTPAT